MPGSDMTPEAALMKLAYVLGKDDATQEERIQVRMRSRDA